MKKKILAILEKYESKEYWVDTQFKIPKCAYDLIASEIEKEVIKEKKKRKI